MLVSGKKDGSTRSRIDNFKPFVAYCVFDILIEVSQVFKNVLNSFLITKFPVLCTIAYHGIKALIILYVNE
jgi:hypothetical protein